MTGPRSCAPQRGNSSDMHRPGVQRGHPGARAKTIAFVAERLGGGLVALGVRDREAPATTRVTIEDPVAGSGRVPRSRRPPRRGRAGAACRLAATAGARTDL